MILDKVVDLLDAADEIVKQKLERNGDLTSADRKELTTVEHRIMLARDRARSVQEALAEKGVLE